MRIRALILDKFRKIKWYVPAVIILPALIYLPGILGGIPFASETAEYSDLLISHYPYALVIKRSIIEYLAVPLWSSFIYSGMPIAANPLSGLFYLPGWIALLFPLPEGISIVLGLHIVFGSFGFYLLLKGEGLGEAASLTGALVFGFMPKIAAHYGAGHVTLIYAICWTPWLLASRRKNPNGWSSGIIAGMLFLADPRWSIYAGILWLSYEIAHSQYPNFKKEFLYFLKASTAAFLVAAPLVLSLIEFSKLSTRSALTLQDMLTFSLPGRMLAGLILPGAGGNTEWVIYSGGGVIGLLILQLFQKKSRKENLFWSVWFIMGIILALGSLYSSADWIAKIPIISMIRVPTRAFFISGISLAVIAGKTLHSFFIWNGEDTSIYRGAIGMAASSILIIIGLGILGMEPFYLIMWGFGFSAAVSIVIIIAIRIDRYRKIIWIVSVLLVVDLGLSSFSFIDFRQPIKDNQQFEYLELLKNNQVDPQRIYSPSYSIPLHLAVENNLELADGVDPMQLTSYRDFMEDATGVEASGYGVTIPHFETGNPGSDNRGAKLNTEYLALLNVRYVVSEFKVDDPNLELVEKRNSKYVYSHESEFPRAWVEPFDGTNSIPEVDEISPASIINRRPNSIVIRGEGPGRLVLSEIYYPGWSAVVDGEPVLIEPAYGILRSVNIDEGEHSIALSYHPIYVYLGILLAAGFWISTLLSWTGKVL